jgi:hypothetical protein
MYDQLQREAGLPPHLPSPSVHVSLDSLKTLRSSVLSLDTVASVYYIVD